MKIICIGINHKKTSIEVREKFSLNELEQELFLAELKNHPQVAEGFVLSTCNRTEIYANVVNDERSIEEVMRLLFALKRIPYRKILSNHFYVYTDKPAVEHLLNVSVGLDSLVIGEKEILGQVKRAIKLAQEKTFLGKEFNILSNLVIRAGKKTRTETDIGFGSLSVSWAAVVKAEEICGTLENKSVLLIGAGKMSELTAKQLVGKNLKEIFVMNRTLENGEMLAEKIGGISVSLCDMKELLQKVDVCICSSAAPHYVIEKQAVKRVMEDRNNKPLAFVDISVPRNIDPRVSEIDNITIHSIDDLQKVTKINMETRLKSIPKAKAIISEKIDEFYTKIDKIKQYESVNVI